MMKDLLNKMSQLEAKSAPKPRQVLNESSPAPVATTALKRSLKDVFNELSEGIAPGAKPLPVMDPTNKKTGMGFVTSNNPAVQNILKNLDPKDVQIVQAPGQQPNQQSQQTQQQSLQPMQASNQPNQPMQEDELDEKWGGNVKLNPAKKGMFKGKTKAELQKQLTALHKSGPHKKGSPEYTKQQELNFAIRAKSGWKDSVEEGDIAPTSGIDTKGAGLGAGRSATTLENKRNDMSTTRREPNKVAGANRKTARESFEFEGRRGDEPQGFGEMDPTTTIFNQIKKALGPISNISSFVVRNVVSLLWNRDENFREQSKRAGLANLDDLVNAFISRFKKNEIAEAKPDFLDLDKDGNKKESMKKAASDAKKKKTVKESRHARIQAARLEGKAHGLKGHAHSGKNYDDMEECRAYHEGYKEGLDECHGMGPVVGLVRPPRIAARPRTMARDALNTPLDEMFNEDDDWAARRMADHEDWKQENPNHPEVNFRNHDDFNNFNAARDNERRARGEIPESDMEEGNAFTGALAKTPKGGHFKVGGKTFTDRSNYDAKMDESDFAFEAWDRQLKSLINEGLSVSISKGNQNSPDSVNVNATDAEADKLLALVKQAGMGIFGGDDHSDYGAPEMGGASEINTPGGIEVVGDHDGMMGLMKKLSGIQGSASDYEDEEGGCEECGHSPCGCNDEEEMSEARCNECGMMESKCGCNEEALDEVQSEDQMAYEVAEDDTQPQNPADNGSANSTNATKGNNASNMALAVADKKPGAPAQADDEEDEEEDDLEESFSFESIYKKLSMLEGKECTKCHKNPCKCEGKKKDKKEKVDEWANKAGPGNSVSDTTFEQDIDFMTKVIAGGLNKPKSTGQTTVPVVASQLKRMHSHDTTDINESVSDWKKLAGIK